MDDNWAAWGRALSIAKQTADMLSAAGVPPQSWEAHPAVGNGFEVEAWRLPSYSHYAPGQVSGRTAYDGGSVAGSAAITVEGTIWKVREGHSKIIGQTRWLKKPIRSAPYPILDQRIGQAFSYAQYGLNPVSLTEILNQARQDHGIPIVPD